MKTKANTIAKTGMKVGAVLGGLGFLVFGIVPGFQYGSYGVLMLLSKLNGAPLDFTLGVRMMVVLGILLGILSLAFMSIVLGSVLGSISGYVVHTLTAGRGHEEGKKSLKH